MKNSLLVLVGCIALLHSNCGNAQTKKVSNKSSAEVAATKAYPMTFSDAEWKAKLTPKQYYILRQQGTEPAGSGKYDHFYEKGTYYSAASLQPVFSSAAKFNSHTGWPSFNAPVSADAIKLIADESAGMERVEVVDSKSGSHLGHVFDDGPPPTGKRYCLNSDALIFVPEGGKPPVNSKN